MTVVTSSASANSHTPRDALQADTDLLGEREQMQRAFAEWVAMRADWAAQQAAARAKILSDRYPNVKDEFEVEEVRLLKPCAALFRLNRNRMPFDFCC